MPQLLGRDKAHFWSNLIVGIEIPRSYFRSLSQKRFIKLYCWIWNIWLIANDNDVAKVERPKWLPKKYPKPTNWKKQ